MTDFIQRIKKTERRRILVCGLLAVNIFLLISNVVTHHTVKTLTEELDNCNSQYDALADEYDRLVLDSEALRDSNESLSSQLETLSARWWWNCKARQRRIKPSGTKRMFWWASAVCRIM